MKKILALALVMVLALALFAGCKTKDPDPVAPGTDPVTPPTTNTYELALVTDVGTIDDKSFNQGAWEGLVKYAKEKSITNKYYQPAAKDTPAYLDSIELAVKNGAKVVVCPGFLFEPAVLEAQDKYPDVKFILLDGSPNNGAYDNTRVEKVGSNTYSVFYAEEQAGFLAGYAAVKDGYKSLGFMGGMAVPAVIRFGYGFAQGADYAAAELGLAKDEIALQYHYTGGFDATPEVQALAASWYQKGTELIFACGGAVGNSVMKAAESTTGKAVIGVDIDQSVESATVITSSMKGLGTSVYDALEAFYAGNFPGGKSVSLGADVDGVGLPMANSKFKTFSQADYDKIYKALATDENKIASSILDNTFGGDENTEFSPAKMTFKCTKVSFVK